MGLDHLIWEILLTVPSIRCNYNSINAALSVVANVVLPYVHIIAWLKLLSKWTYISCSFLFVYCWKLMIQSNPIFFCDRLLVNENPVNSFTSLHTSVNHCCLDLRVQAYVTVHTQKLHWCLCLGSICYLYQSFYVEVGSRRAQKWGKICEQQS